MQTDITPKSKQSSKQSKFIPIVILAIAVTAILFVIFTHPVYHYDDGIGDKYTISFDWINGSTYYNKESTYDAPTDEDPDATQTVAADGKFFLSLSERSLFFRAKLKNYDQAMYALMLITDDEIAGKYENTSYRELASEIWQDIIDEKKVTEEKTEMEEFNESFFAENEKRINDDLKELGLDSVDFDDEEKSASEQIQDQIDKIDEDSCKDCKLD